MQKTLNRWRVGHKRIAGSKEKAANERVDMN